MKKRIAIDVAFDPRHVDPNLYRIADRDLDYSQLRQIHFVFRDAAIQSLVDHGVDLSVAGLYLDKADLFGVSTAVVDV